MLKEGVLMTVLASNVVFAFVHQDDDLSTGGDAREIAVQAGYVAASPEEGVAIGAGESGQAIRIGLLGCKQYAPSDAVFGLSGAGVASIQLVGVVGDRS